MIFTSFEFVLFFVVVLMVREPTPELYSGKMVSTCGQLCVLHELEHSMCPIDFVYLHCGLFRG